MSEEQWREVSLAAERGLEYLSKRQSAAGAFASDPYGQPGVTSLAAMAFMAWGHGPGEGPYGDCILRALRYAADQQQPNGLISQQGPSGELVPLRSKYAYCVPAAYNHAIAGLALSEAYGSSDAADAARLRPVIEKAVRASLVMQRWQRPAISQGGWRYLHTNDADLSVAGWHLMFLRSAKNAGFEVPKASINDAVAFVMRCYSPQHGTFEYDTKPSDRRSRAMAAAGIMALAHSGEHGRIEAVKSADWILQHRFGQYNAPFNVNRDFPGDRYHYGVFYCCQAMYQMGGRHWREFFPPTVGVLLANQSSDGSWDEEGNQDTRFGRTYTTSLVLLALGAPNQLLPVFQR
ncbi:MAG: terpene cyclase/mutase family protein [Planctomycetales bacterium]|nr:terpene cyclase/mutase family protein [Planctomycetales bacterium]